MKVMEKSSIDIVQNAEHNNIVRWAGSNHKLANQMNRIKNNKTSNNEIQNHQPNDIKE